MPYVGCIQLPVLVTHTSEASRSPPKHSRCSFQKHSQTGHIGHKRANEYLGLLQGSAIRLYDIFAHLLRSPGLQAVVLSAYFCACAPLLTTACCTMHPGHDHHQNVLHLLQPHVPDNSQSSRSLRCCQAMLGIQQLLYVGARLAAQLLGNAMDNLWASLKQWYQSQCKVSCTKHAFRCPIVFDWLTDIQLQICFQPQLIVHASSALPECTQGCCCISCSRLSDTANLILLFLASTQGHHRPAFIVSHNLAGSHGLAQTQA